MKVETHFLLIFFVLSLYIVILYFIYNCNDYIKVFNTNDTRVDNRPIWKCLDENDKTSRLTNIYNTEKHLESMGILDKWSFTHITHGLFIFAVLLYLNGGTRNITLVYLTLFIEIIWEILENTPYIINSYRRSRSIYKEYIGDSIANIISDTIFCLFGIIIAWYLPINSILILTVIIEFVSYLIIDDNVIINVYSLLLETLKKFKNLFVINK